MENFQMTRSALAEFLQALRDDMGYSPLSVLKRTLHNVSNEEDIITNVPPLFSKLMNMKQDARGLSINEIASLGNHLEFTNVTSTAIQNWVKRELKTLIGSPVLGRKYSLDQAAILLIVEDLKVVLDLDSIRKVLTLIFNNPADRSDDLLDPLSFYKGYSDIFEDLRNHNNTILEDEYIEEKATTFINRYQIEEKEKFVIKNLLSLSVLSIQTSRYQTKARNYLERTIIQ